MPVSEPRSRRRLEFVEDMLHHDYGFLLTILPRRVFVTCNGRIILNPKYYPKDNRDQSPVYGFLFGKDRVLQLENSAHPEKRPGKLTPKHQENETILSSPDEQAAAFNQVPPLSWIESSPDWYGSGAWRRQTFALIFYFRLVWAFDEDYNITEVPFPVLSYVKDAFDLLKRTRYYEQAMVRRDDAEFLDVHVSCLQDLQKRMLGCALQTDQSRQVEDGPVVRPNGVERGGSHASLSTTEELASRNTTDGSFSDDASRSSSPEGSFGAPPASSLIVRLQIRKIRDTPFSHDDINGLGLTLEDGVSEAELSAEVASRRAMPAREATSELQGDSQCTISADSAISTHASPRATPDRSPRADQEVLNQQPDPASSSVGSATNAGISQAVALTAPSRATEYEETVQEIARASILSRTVSQTYATMGPKLSKPPRTEHNDKGVRLSQDYDSSASTARIDDALAETLAGAHLDTDPGAPGQQQKPDSRGAGPDRHLAHLQKKVGSDLLSLLPDLSTVTFKGLHPSQERPGYLSIRMLFGTGKQSAPPRLRGHKVWIVYKIHDARTAPRVLFDALSSDDNTLLEENLAFKTTLSELDLEPVFNLVTEPGLKREHQLKAVIKYYYILAANAALYGFHEHLMPANDTFVEQMRTVCTRIQNHDGLPQPRKRRRVAPEYEIAMPSMSEPDDESFPIHTQPGRRSSRNLKRTLSGATAADMADHESPYPPFRYKSKLALGAIILKDSPSHMKNEFLDPNIEARDSDGDSGDEIPDRVPGHMHDILLQRAKAKKMISLNNTWVRDLRDMKKAHEKVARKLESQVQRGQAEPQEAQPKIELEKRSASNRQHLIEQRQKILSGFKKKEKELDAQVKLMDKGSVRMWEEWRKGQVLKEAEEEDEKQNQQRAG
ncbi:hypothetical protein K458DRAFT_436253 [Lentithecium fluviatile CBS 122367]|uniref:Uncharacterized protein n=1 Tax=Lentithecium fluviatile CBS 122367 TaxID=1168545 RepID=A0A6G1IIN7_9PLEO|nr:hypothetical protein K458DRAFT_436253 [Lentithecium fluviatile CBS 122367]